jgi:hypothetical protein
MTGQLLGPVDVYDGSQAVIATTQQGNKESGGISLQIANPQALADLKTGANYTLRTTDGRNFHCVARGEDGEYYQFSVAS